MEIKHETVALYQRQRKPRRDIFNINGGRCGKKGDNIKNFIYIINYTATVQTTLS